MRDDVRDRALADTMDRAVRGIESPVDARLPAIRRRGARRRAATWTAIGVAMAVFVGALGFAAATRIGRQQPADQRGWTRFGGQEAGWTIRYPASWHLQSIDDRSCAASSVRIGAFISIVPFDLHAPDGSTEGECNGGRWVFAEFPPNGVAIGIEPVGMMHGLVKPQPDTRFPVRVRDVGAFNHKHGLEHSLWQIWRGGHWLMNVRLYVGNNSVPTDQRRAATVLASLRLAVPAHSVPRLGNCPTARGVAANFAPLGQGVVRGDIDGDGRTDAAWIVDVPGFPDSCSRFVVVQTARGRLAARVPEWWVPQLPQVAALAHIESGQGSDVVVTFDAGGFSRQVAIFSIRNGDLVSLRLPDIFIVADAKREAANLDCAGGPGCGVIVWTTTGSRRGPSTDVLRTFYRVVGRQLLLEPPRTEGLRVPAASVGTPLMKSSAPEMADLDVMFPSCRAS